MPIDFTKPAITDNYSTAFVPNLNNAIQALGMWLDPATAGTVTSPPTGAKRYNAGAVEQFDGTSWVKKPVNGISFDGTNSSVSGVLSAASDGGLKVQHDAAASAAWCGRVMSKNATADRATFIGNYNGAAVVGAHNNALSAWAALYVNCVDNSNGGSVYMTGSVFMGGYQALHANNFNTYAPKLDGTGASGSWGISVTGSAGSLSGFTNSTGTSAVAGPDTLTNNGLAYVTGMPTTVAPNAITDGALYAQANSATWVHQIYGDYRTGQLAVRGKNNGSWTTWRTVLDSTNYTDYATARVSSTRPGVTKLYRRDDDSAYNVQTSWTGSYWLLQGYAGDAYHAGCQVAYATSAGSAAAVSDSGSSKAASGYVVLPGSGLIIQWGVITGDGSYTFPTAFPTACQSISLGSAVIGNGVPRVLSKSTTGFSYASANFTNQQANWIAIGY